MKKTFTRGPALRNSKGFTLIELLVVIAIIGILAAIILASLGTARSKGIDAGTKSDLNSVRSQMELFAAGNTNSYSGGCAAVPSGAGTILTSTFNNVKGQVTGGAVVTVAATAGTYNNVTCHDSAGAWAAEAPMAASISGTPAMWCIDSTGNSKAEAVNFGASIFRCT